MKTLIAFTLLFSTLASADQFRAKAILENDDGSVTIQTPGYEITSAGKTLPISSATSNLNGVCMAFGLGKNASVFDGNQRIREFAVVNSRGLFDRSISKKELENTGNRRTAVSEIICTLDNSSRLAKTSLRAEKIINLGNGSVRIMTPSFGMIGGIERHFSEQTTLSGLCRLYGYEHVSSEAEKINSHYENHLALLNRDGHFSGLSQDARGSIQSIACDGALPYRLNANFYPEGLSSTLQGIAYAVRPIIANYIDAVAQNITQVAPIPPSGSRMLKDSSFLTRSEALRLLELELLVPVFDSLTSEWFESDVRPVLVKERGDLQRQFGYQTARDLSKHDGALELLIYQAVSSIDAMSKEVSSIEAVKWLVSLKANLGRLQASSKKTNALIDFLRTWDEGRPLLQEVRSNLGLEGLVGSLEINCEILRELK